MTLVVPTSNNFSLETTREESKSQSLDAAFHAFFAGELDESTPNAADETQNRHSLMGLQQKQDQPVTSSDEGPDDLIATDNDPENMLTKNELERPSGNLERLETFGQPDRHNNEDSRTIVTNDSQWVSATLRKTDKSHVENVSEVTTRPALGIGISATAQTIARRDDQATSQARAVDAERSGTSDASTAPLHVTNPTQTTVASLASQELTQASQEVTRNFSFGALPKASTTLGKASKDEVAAVISLSVPEWSRMPRNDEVRLPPIGASVGADKALGAPTNDAQLSRPSLAERVISTTRNDGTSIEAGHDTVSLSGRHVGQYSAVGEMRREYLRPYEVIQNGHPIEANPAVQGNVKKSDVTVTAYALDTQVKAPPNTQTPVSTSGLETVPAMSLAAEPGVKETSKLYESLRVLPVDAETNVSASMDGIRNHDQTHVVRQPSAPDTRQADLARQIAVQISQNVAGSSGSLVELQLAPEELGLLKFRMSLSEGAVTIFVQAERPETNDLMRRHIDHLQAQFASLGFGETSVSLGGNSSFDEQSSQEDEQLEMHTSGVSADSETKPMHGVITSQGVDIRV